MGIKQDLEKRLKAEQQGKKLQDPTLEVKQAAGGIMMVTVAELRAAVAGNPQRANCDICKAFTNACTDRNDDPLPDTRELFVERVDLQACLEGKGVTVKTQVVNNVRVTTKEVTSTPAPPAPTAADPV